MDNNPIQDSPSLRLFAELSQREKKNKKLNISFSMQIEGSFPQFSDSSVSSLMQKSI